MRIEIDSAFGGSSILYLSAQNMNCGGIIAF